MKRSRDAVSDEDSVSITSSHEERMSGYYSEPDIIFPPNLNDVVTSYNFMDNIHRCFGEHVEPPKLNPTGST
jgi:hypothetical protein